MELSLQNNLMLQFVGSKKRFLTLTELISTSSVKFSKDNTVRR